MNPILYQEINFYMRSEGRKKVWGLFILLLSWRNVHAQKDSIYSDQIQVLVDNDAFVPGRMDRFYSSGIFLRWDHLLSNNFSLQTQFSQLIYTPDLKVNPYSFPQLYERPFAGAHLLETALYWKTDQWIFAPKISLGKIGPTSRVDRIHIWYHKNFGFDKPQGWETQVPDSFLANFSISASKSIWENDLIGLSLVNEADFGNWEKSMSISPMIRMGKISPWIHSQASGTRVGSIFGEEQFFLLRAKMTRRFYHASLDTEDSNFPFLFEFEPSPWIAELQGKIVLQYRHLGMEYGINYRTRENPEAEGQVFGRFGLSFIF
jgi:lipid A 3-O-deacylase